MDSIQDYLISIGFKAGDDTFARDFVTIPVAEIIGHTVDSFKRKAINKGWIQPEEVHGVGWRNTPASQGAGMVLEVPPDADSSIDKVWRELRAMLDSHCELDREQKVLKLIKGEELLPDSIGAQSDAAPEVPIWKSFYGILWEWEWEWERQQEAIANTAWRALRTVLDRGQTENREKKPIPCVSVRSDLGGDVLSRLLQFLRDGDKDKELNFEIDRETSTLRVYCHREPIQDFVLSKEEKI